MKKNLHRHSFKHQLNIIVERSDYGKRERAWGSAVVFTPWWSVVFILTR